MAVGLLVCPTAVLVEFLLVFLEVRRQVACRAPLGQKGIPGFIPAVEVVGPGTKIAGIADQAAVRGGQRLLGSDDLGPLFAGGLEAALENEDLGPVVQADVEPVEALIEDIVGRVGGMDLDGLIACECPDAQEGAPFEDVDFDPSIALGRKDGELDLAVVVEPEVVPLAELDFDLTGPGPELVALNKHQVDLTPLGPEVRRPLHEDFAIDIIQSGEARGVVPFGRGLRLGQKPERNANEESDREEHCFLHRLSPSMDMRLQLTCHSLRLGNRGGRPIKRTVSGTRVTWRGIGQKRALGGKKRDNPLEGIVP
jgi:hypothetical protein